MTNPDLPVAQYQMYGTLRTASGYRKTATPGVHFRSKTCIQIFIEMKNFRLNILVVLERQEHVLPNESVYVVLQVLGMTNISFFLSTGIDLRSI
jgi:hypothetical protein